MSHENITVHIPTEPSYYGSDVSNEEAAEIANRYAKIVEAKFPEVTVELTGTPLQERVFSTNSDDDEICQTIIRWMDANWTAAL